MNYKKGRPLNIFKPHYAVVGNEVYIRKYDPWFFRWVYKVSRWIYESHKPTRWTSNIALSEPINPADRPVWVSKKEQAEQQVKINGKYAIRKWDDVWGRLAYQDLTWSRFWWTQYSQYFEDCLSDTPIRPIQSTRVVDFNEIG